MVNGKLYVFGGLGKPTPEATTSVFNQVHAYDPATNSWQELKTRAPLEIGGGTAVAQDDRILLFGGVNRNIFNGYFTDIAAAGTDKAASDAVALAYFNGRPQDYSVWQGSAELHPRHQHLAVAGHRALHGPRRGRHQPSGRHPDGGQRRDQARTAHGTGGPRHREGRRRDLE